MAKNGNGIWKKAGVIITVVVLGVGIVAGFVTNTHQIKDNGEKIGDHEIRLRPVEKNTTEQTIQIQNINKTLEKMDKTLDRIEQKIPLGPSSFMIPENNHDPDCTCIECVEQACREGRCGVYHGPPTVEVLPYGTWQNN